MLYRINELDNTAYFTSNIINTSQITYISEDTTGVSRIFFTGGNVLEITRDQGQEIYQAAKNREASLQQAIAALTEAIKGSVK